MQSINEIKNKKFEKSAFGYKVDDVEEYLNEIIAYIDTLEKEKSESQKKLVVLANKIEEYRNEEDSLRQALLGAQKLADNILKEAKNRAEIMMRDATIKSENIIKNVKEDVKREEVILNKIKREVDAFRNKMLTMYSSHIEMIKSIPELERAEEKVEETPEKIAETETVAQPVIENEVVEEKEVVETDLENKEEVPADSATDNDSTKEIAPVVEKNEESKFAGGFIFNRYDDKKQSKFGPLKFGDSYDFDDDAKK